MGMKHPQVLYRGMHRDTQPPAEAASDIERWLMRAALSYINRYPTSQANLSRVLVRKLQRRLDDPDEAAALVARVVDRLVEARLVDDSLFAGARVAALKRRGISAAVTRAKLREKGVDEATASTALLEEGHDEREAAHAYARRRGLGPFRVRDRTGRRDRDVAAMARAGFPVDIAIDIVDGDRDWNDPQR